jgi:hypothetical protein
MRTHQRTVGLPTLQQAAAPSSNPTGLAWDGANLWSSDGSTSLLYRHASDLRVLEAVKSLLPNPSGLTYDNGSLWVVGGTPLKLARLDRHADGWVWSGPYDVSHLLTEGVQPSGVAIGFGRLWMISSGDPRLMSRSLAELTSQPMGWKVPVKPKEKKEKKKEKKDANRKA